MKHVSHILKLQKFGSAPSRDCVRSMAYELADILDIKHTFNNSVRKAGYNWVSRFLNRHPELSDRKAEGISF